jgi:hypothetical protein
VLLRIRVYQNPKYVRTRSGSDGIKNSTLVVEEYADDCRNASEPLALQIRRASVSQSPS